MKLNNPVKFNGYPLLGVDDISVAFGNLRQTEWSDIPKDDTVWVRICFGSKDSDTENNINHKYILTPYMDASVISTSFTMGSDSDNVTRQELNDQIYHGYNIKYTIDICKTNRTLWNLLKCKQVGVFIETNNETFNIFPEIRYYLSIKDDFEHIMLDIYFTDNFETMYNGATVYVKA
jgi:hypothetical protein